MDYRNKIFKEYELTEDHVISFEKDGNSIKMINRQGIDLIESKCPAEINMELFHFSSHYNPKSGRLENVAVVQGTASLDGEMVYATGESNPSNDDFNFPAAVAEKRCRSRLLLKIIGLYQLGYYSEDEIPEKDRPKKRKNLVDNTLEAIGSKGKK